MSISLINRLFTVIYKGNQHFASPLDHFGGPKLFPGGPKSLENLRNRVFASSRYDLNKILSKNIKFRESYSLLEKGNLRVQGSSSKKNILI